MNHRFQEQMPRDWQPEAYPARAVVVGAGFVVCPVAVQLVSQPGSVTIYQQALEKALMQARPSILERYQACLSN